MIHDWSWLALRSFLKRSVKRFTVSEREKKNAMTYTTTGKANPASRQTERSPARRATKSPSRRGAKSPSRASPGRRKSPSRKLRSPIKDAQELTKSLKEEIIRIQPEVLLINHDRRDGFITPVRDLRDSRESSVSSIFKRRSLRVLASREKVEEESYEESKGIEQLTASEDTEIEYPEKPSKNDNEPATEFGGALGALFLPILFQVFLLTSHLYVSKAHYGIKGFKVPFDWQTYFDWEVSAVCLGFIALQLILSVLPIGKLVDGLPGKLGKLQYRCNGVVNLIISVAILAGLRHFKYPVTMVADKFIHLIITSLLFGHVLTMILYAKSSRTSIMAQNPYAVTGSRIYDFYMGREVNPRIGPFDLKTGLLRISFIGMSLDENKACSPALLVSAGLQMWFALDALWCEESFLSSFEIMYEGTGQMFILQSMAYPFIRTIITRSIAHPLPYIVPLFTTLLLAHRAKRDDSRCRQRYSASWDRYCSRVKYCIMPKVF
ncbi:hypothetical protein C0J52_19387 [Blattella germanica]|nr:hypothetical protein C0J52_19387 [Blattella germanica]